MEDKKKPDQPTTDAMKGYNPTDRDFQRTEGETDRIDESEVEAENKNTARANTEPDKNKIN